MSIHQPPDNKINKEIRKWLQECEELILKRLHEMGMTHVKKGDFHLELHERVRHE